jgi:hypothetical protein
MSLVATQTLRIGFSEGCALAASTGTPRRNRPPKWLTEAKSTEGLAQKKTK